MHTIRTSGIIIASTSNRGWNHQSPSHITWLEIEEMIWAEGPWRYHLRWISENQVFTGSL